MYLRQVGGATQPIQYSYNQTSWITLTFPVTVRNTDATPTSVFSVIFTTDISLPSSNAGNQYFECLSSHIQFGSSELGAGGTRPTITVTDTNGGFIGLILNGSDGVAGRSNIYVYNLVVSGLDSELNAGGGWIGATFFGNGAAENYITNCSSDGYIPPSGGGIVGSNAGGGTDGSLQIFGCTSYGSVNQAGGGMAGQYAGENGGNISCIQCASFGLILGGGGIFGDYAGSGGTAAANKCYSTEAIGTDFPAGGIYGNYAGNTSGVANATACYSRGDVLNSGGNSGGIFGENAGTGSGVATAFNCYSNGALYNPGRGIFGLTSGTANDPNCYVGNGNWDAGDAAAALNGVGTTWIEVGVGNPFLLKPFGYTPYSLNNINTGGDFNSDSRIGILQGGQTSGVVVTLQGQDSVDIYSVNGVVFTGQFNLSIDVLTGVISAAVDTPVGTYNLVIFAFVNGIYSTTNFELTVQASPTPPTPTQQESNTTTIIAVCIFLAVLLFLLA